ncbi:geraniol 8-hydroxylase-like isoform X2 [Cynara cardunculus var. scolymus]|uniref:geraniol 8-hydroxylase-like isoform X2 n=1 Tax=Cynara cardunculus var. scolymus TaxID=59895 RepID=UPI000D62EC6C|nr:geraniol 8-hydroxylase-like isoform X2 [Cynara cardunculus var. scolymus]
MSLKLGTTTTIVVSSREIVKEFFSKHDVSFSGRSVPYVATAHDHYKHAMGWSQVGDHWRMLRKIYKEHLFAARQLDASHLLRKKKYDSQSSQDFMDLVWLLFENAGRPNLADFFPVLRPLDPHGLLRKAKLYTGKLLAIVEEYISKRLQERTATSSSDASSSKDLMDLLLDMSQNEKSSINLVGIRYLVFDLFIAGTETTSSTLEWAMAELINNPEKMSKARSELEEVIRKEDRTFEESDIARLPYLQAVVKETLRLHPPVTFLLPHKATTNVEVQGYIVPKDAQILCNLWAMGQDSNVWPNAQRFEPERFLDVGIDYKGHDFELIPFGTGRRMCPGLPLADRMLHLMLGSLIYKFDWKIKGGMMDMSDKFGMTLQKNLPLMAIPVKV